MEKHEEGSAKFVEQGENPRDREAASKLSRGAELACYRRPEVRKQALGVVAVLTTFELQGTSRPIHT